MAQTMVQPLRPDRRRRYEGSDLRVALMGRSLRGQFSGVVRYTDELVRALAAELGEELYVFVTKAEDGLDGLPIRKVRAPFSTPNEYVRAVWEQIFVPVDVRRIVPDVYHSPNYILPAAIGCPSVVTVHDVAFLDRAVHRLRSHLYLSALTVLALRKATIIVCVSSYTARRLTARFPWAGGKIRVVGEGISSQFRPQPRAAVDAFRERHGLRKPYVLFVGTVEPRKNLPRLIRAFERAAVRERLPHELVIAGATGWKTGAVQDAYERSALKDRVRFLGYIPDEELPAAYGGAEAFAYPSLHEGFGLPPLEAMACGTPVVTSNTTALAEVSGPAALTVDPKDDHALESAIAALLGDGARREEMVKAGLSHARSYRWDQVALQMIDIYREAAR